MALSGVALTDQNAAVGVRRDDIDGGVRERLWLHWPRVTRHGSMLVMVRRFVLIVPARSARETGRVSWNGPE